MREKNKQDYLNAPHATMGDIEFSYFYIGIVYLPVANVALLISRRA